MSPRIVDIREVTKPISSPIRNAYIDFSKMTASLVAVITNVNRNGRPVVGYGFNSNGRYGQGGLIRERFAPRLLEADPKLLMDATGENIDPDRAWTTMMANEKPGGHGERSVAVGTLDMAIWDAVAKIAGKPLSGHPAGLTLREGGAAVGGGRPYRRPGSRTAGAQRAHRPLARTLDLSQARRELPHGGYRLRVAAGPGLGKTA